MTYILVVDDEELVRATIRQILEKSNYVVFEAGNGDEALRALDKNQIDMVITDIVMPKKEGIETIIELRQQKPDLKIIAISGGGRTLDVDYLEIAEKFGANGVLAKPFRREQVLNIVKDVLAQAG